MAQEFDCAESTIDEMVKRGVLPPPMRLSTGCVRWCWADVQIAVDSLRHRVAANQTTADPFIKGAQNVHKNSESDRDVA
jgi:predicted DNA-binding transcriptional regulator AlpA